MPPGGHGVEIQELEYRCGEATVPGRLYRPAPGGGPRPGLLLCPGRLREIDGLDFLARACAEAGYVTLATRYRGMDFSTDDDDASAGLDFLERLDGVDPARLAVAGHSRGGMCGLRLAARDPRPKTAVILQPPTDFVQYMLATKLYSPLRYQALVASMGGEPWDRPEFYQAFSPINHAARIRIPVLLLYGSADLFSPADHGHWMQAALKRAGNDAVELVVLEGVGHFFEVGYAERAFEAVAQHALAWLRRTMPESAMLARLGQFAFFAQGDQVRVATPTGSVSIGAARLRQGLRTWVALRMEIEGQTDFPGGFSITNAGETIIFQASGHREAFPKSAAEALFHELVSQIPA